VRQAPEAAMMMKGRYLAAAGMVGAIALALSSCQQLAFKEQIKGLVAPVNPTSPWITSYGDRSVTLTWAEPSDADMGAVEIIATPKYGSGATPLQAVIAPGTQGATLNLPTNNARYTIGVFMVDKGGNVSNSGTSTTTGQTFHSLLDPGATVQGGDLSVLNTFASQLPTKTVTHFDGTGGGAFTSTDAYTYDSTTGLPSEVITYDSKGAPQLKHDISYSSGGVNRVLDVLYTYSGTGWTLLGYANTFYDSSGRVVKTESFGNNYGNSLLHLVFTSTYNYDTDGTLTGWVTHDELGNVSANTTYLDLGTKEQWARADANGVVQPGGLIEADYDPAGRPTQLIEYNSSDMSIAFKLTYDYDENGNTQKMTMYGGNPLLQQGYLIYSY
jgi:hypothetical protein